MEAGTISVTTNQASCAWGFATNSPDWILLTAQGANGNSVTGSGAVSVTVLASSLPTQRTGSITIHGGNSTQNITVSQGAAICSLALQPAAGTIGAGGGTGSFGVQTPAHGRHRAMRSG